MAILKYLIFVVFLILFPLGQVIRFDLGNGISIVPLDMGVTLTSLFYLFTIWNRKQVKAEFLKPILVFIGVLFLSLLLNFKNLEPKQFMISGLYLLRIASYLLIYFLVVTNKSFKQFIPRVMLISGITLLSIGFAQYIFYPNLRNLYYLGWDEHLYRLFSSFLDPNFAGSFFVLFLLFIQVALKGKSKYILSFFTIFGILLTYSRSAYLMLIFAVLSFLIMKKRFKQVLLFIGTFLIILIFITKTSLSSEGTNLLRTASGEARLDSARNAIMIFKDNPIFGVGFDSYRFAQHKYGFLSKDWENVHSGAGTDNSFLFVLATSGVIGFSAYIYLLFRIIKSSLASKNRYSIVLLCSTVGLIIDSFFINSLFYPPILLWYVVLLGITENN